MTIHFTYLSKLVHRIGFALKASNQIQNYGIVLIKCGRRLKHNTKINQHCEYLSVNC